MPMVRIERVSRQFTGINGGNTADLYRLSSRDVVIGVSARVKQVCDGDGAVILGVPAATGHFFTSALLAPTVLGKKIDAAHSGFQNDGGRRGNGFKPDDETDAQCIVRCAYTETTAVVHPIIEFVLLVIRQDVLDDLMVA